MPLGAARKTSTLSLAPHQFWQDIAPAGTYDTAPAEGFVDSYPAQLADGRQLLLPIRVLPGDGSRAVASMIVNQASFAVEDALAEVLVESLRPYDPEVIIGVPTLGLPLAANVARRFGHSRMVALGTSRKFWYLDALSEPMSSITSPTHAKTIFVDPRMLPLLEGRRVVVIDDVISSGTSMAAVLRLLEKADIPPVAIATAMLQSTRWQEPLTPWLDRIVSATRSPLLHKTASNRWEPAV